MTYEASRNICTPAARNAQRGHIAGRTASTVSHNTAVLVCVHERARRSRGAGGRRRAANGRPRRAVVSAQFPLVAWTWTAGGRDRKRCGIGCRDTLIRRMHREYWGRPAALQCISHDHNTGATIAARSPLTAATAATEAARAGGAHATTVAASSATAHSAKRGRTAPRLPCAAAAAAVIEEQAGYVGRQP